MNFEINRWSGYWKFRNSGFNNGIHKGFQINGHEMQCLSVNASNSLTNNSFFNTGNKISNKKLPNKTSKLNFKTKVKNKT